MTDPDATFRAALEYCGSLVTNPEHVGAPILVATVEDGVVVWPPLRIELGDPVVRLTVQGDGVRAASMRCGWPWVFAATFFRYPLGPDGRPCLTGWPDALWREQVGDWVTGALSKLPAPRLALASP